MANTEFVYEIYVLAAPRQIWDALIKAELTKKYWGHVNVSDWKPGATWEHRDADAPGELKLVGRVIEFTPPRRLVLTWASPADAADPRTHSRVTIGLEPIGDMVRLKITHTGLEQGSEMHTAIMEGWPRVLSSLKSLLETGKPLPTWAKATR